MNNRAFTLIEMLIVMSIILTGSLLSLSLSNSQIILHDEVLNQISQHLEMARLDAVLNQSRIALKFTNHSIWVDDQIVYEEANIHFLEEKEIYFNSKGHISQGITIPFFINKQLYHLIFTIGQGAYRIEKQ